MYMDVDMDMNMRFESVPKLSLIGARSDQTWAKSCPKSIQNVSHMVQNEVRDGLLRIRVDMLRSWTATPTATPIHEAVLGGLLKSCWDSCWVLF